MSKLAKLNYVAKMDVEPVMDMRNLPNISHNLKADSKLVTIHNARNLKFKPNLDMQGFTLVKFRSSVPNLYDAQHVQKNYYSEIEALVTEVTGAKRVFAFQHNVRGFGLVGKKEIDGREPVYRVHNDYTKESGPRRVRDLLGAEAEKLLKSRVAIVNVWKPIIGPVTQSPLAICDSQSLREEERVTIRLRYEERDGFVTGFRYSDAHRWYFYSSMVPEEALLFKCYDSDSSVSFSSAHSAFADPDAPTDAPARESIEVRTMVFW